MSEHEQAVKRTVLLVEDDKFLRDIVERHLDAAGFAIISASTGEEALRVAQEQTVDIIVLDIVLSGISGLDVMARLKADAKTASIPFIVFTNSDEKASLERGSELGAVKYMVKALSTPEKIVEEIRSFFVTHS